MSEEKPENETEETPEEESEESSEEESKNSGATVVIGGGKPKLQANTNWDAITPKGGWNIAKHQKHHPIGKTKNN